ncbi:MAG: CRISPR-associated endonuclease Cas2 [Gammaproteobacteria bacterium]|jgi:CRISPR-associated protein Cas2|nr:CRISPR-associated endonuclease Cas2 [Gammaproteobacteria bacterium]
MRYVLICYDIEDDRRRNRVARLLLGWGRRVQYSVFEVACVRESDLQRLKRKLERIHESGDSIRIYRFSEQTRHQSGELDGEPMRECPAVVVI